MRLVPQVGDGQETKDDKRCRHQCEILYTLFFLVLIIISQSFPVALTYIFIKSIVSTYQVSSSELYTVKALLYAFTFI
jgi:hypothetical protein